MRDVLIRIFPMAGLPKDVVASKKEKSFVGQAPIGLVSSYHTVYVWE